VKKAILSAPLILLELVLLSLSLRAQSTTMVVRPPNIIWVANEAATGTTIYTLTKLTGAPSTAIVTTAGDTLGAVGICVSGCGLAAASATASIANWGNTSCVFDGATTAGHYFGISAAVAGNCADAGAAYPIVGQVLGRVLSTNGAGGTYPVILFGPEMQASAPVPAGVPSWSRYAMVKIANGVNGCASANGCWQVNGVLGAAAAAGLTQDVVLFVLPARGHITDYRIKLAVRCTGAATALTGFGTIGTNTLYRAQNYDIDTAVGNTNIANGPPTGAGSDTHGVTEVVGSLINTVNNIDQLVAGCAVDYWALWGTLPL
jgi:hypothetical protein